MLNRIALAMYNWSHLCHSLLPSLTLYPQNQTVLFLSVFSSTRIHSSRCGFSKVQAFRRRHVSSFTRWREASLTPDFRISQAHVSFSWRIVCPHIWSSCKPAILWEVPWPGPPVPHDDLSVQGKKWDCVFLNKWTGSQCHLAFLNASLKYLWTRTNMQIHSTRENQSTSNSFQSPGESGFNATVARLTSTRAQWGHLVLCF